MEPGSGQSTNTHHISPQGAGQHHNAEQATCSSTFPGVLHSSTDLQLVSSPALGLHLMPEPDEHLLSQQKNNGRAKEALAITFLIQDYFTLRNDPAILRTERTGLNPYYQRFPQFPIVFLRTAGLLCSALNSVSQAEIPMLTTPQSNSSQAVV